MISKEQPAFPETHIHHWRGKDPEVGETDNVVPRWNGGLTKREYFAAMAMHGMLANPKIWPMSAEVAENAVLRADALIAALCKK